MRHASYPAAGLAASESAFSGPKTKRRSFFASLIAALHHSRRLEAQRVLRRYQHLVPHPEEGGEIPQRAPLESKQRGS
jgi:hypothetical protein